MPGTIVDMHIHTTNGASDSQLRPEEMAEIAKDIGLTGVNVTEHDRVWDKYTADAFRPPPSISPIRPCAPTPRTAKARSSFSAPTGP